MSIKLENIIDATKQFERIEKICNQSKRITPENYNALKSITEKYGVTIEECKVFSDVLKTEFLEEMIRDAIIEVYTGILLKLREEYLDNQMNNEYDIATKISEDLR